MVNECIGGGEVVDRIYGEVDPLRLPRPIYFWQSLFFTSTTEEYEYSRELIVTVAHQWTWEIDEMIKSSMHIDTRSSRQVCNIPQEA
jgi:hypothetical protein